MAALEGGADGFMYGAITGAVTGGAGRATQALRSTNVTTRSLPRTSKPMTSKNLIRNGKIEQRGFMISGEEPSGILIFRPITIH